MKVVVSPNYILLCKSDMHQNNNLCNQKENPDSLALGGVPRLLRRKYDYSQIDCYYAKGERLLLCPQGEFLPFGGGIQIEPIFEIRTPFERLELEQKIRECFSLCWSKTVDGYPKGPSIIEKYLGIRGYKKIVQQFDFFYITHDKASRTYRLIKLSKAANYKSYSGVETTVEMGEKIDYDYILRLIQEQAL